MERFVVVDGINNYKRCRPANIFEKIFRILATACIEYLHFNVNVRLNIPNMIVEKVCDGTNLELSRRTHNFLPILELYSEMKRFVRYRTAIAEMLKIVKNTDLFPSGIVPANKKSNTNEVKIWEIR